MATMRDADSIPHHKKHRTTSLKEGIPPPPTARALSISEKKSLSRYLKRIEHRLNKLVLKVGCHDRR
jgi:hypothetical protein